MRARALAGAELAYSALAAVGDIRRAHDALSAALTSLAVRAGGGGPQQAFAPLEVRACMQGSVWFACFDVSVEQVWSRKIACACRASTAIGSLQWWETR